MENEMKQINGVRKNYLDNIRWITVVLVMVYHVIYLFNSQGVLSNFNVQGIEILDGFLYVVYPWFMVLLFVVAGISAKYALNKRTGKEFLIDRLKRLIVPSIFVVMFFGWISGWITDYFSDMFQGNGDQIPGIMKYLIYCMSGMGPMWFARELFYASVVLVIIRKIDKMHKLDALCDRMKWWGFIILFFSFWGSSFILNTPLIEVYRNGIYINSFLMGYYIFSNEKHLDVLQRAKKILVPCAVLCAVGYYAYIRIVIEPQATDNVLTTVAYTSKSVLNHPFTNIFAWITILAIFSIARTCLNFRNKFSAYMTKANFGYYALHYPCLCVVAFIAYEKLNLSIGACYIVNLFGMIILTTILYMVLSKIPVIRALTLGIYQRGKKDAGKSRN
ncbi:MAG: acyltransferase family protein [Lachnospiraceae bacterium]